MTAEPQGKFLVSVALVVLVGVVGYYVLTAPDRRTPGEKIGDAVDELGNRTTGDRINDAIKD